MIDLADKLDRLEDCVRLAAHNDAMRGFGCFGPEQARMYRVLMSSACEHRRDIEAEFKKLRERADLWRALAAGALDAYAYNYLPEMDRAMRRIKQEMRDESLGQD